MLSVTPPLSYVICPIRLNVFFSGKSPSSMLSSSKSPSPESKFFLCRQLSLVSINPSHSPAYRCTQMDTKVQRQPGNKTCNHVLHKYLATGGAVNIHEPLQIHWWVTTHTLSWIFLACNKCLQKFANHPWVLERKNFLLHTICAKASPQSLMAAPHLQPLESHNYNWGEGAP